MRSTFYDVQVTNQFTLGELDNFLLTYLYPTEERNRITLCMEKIKAVTNVHRLQ